MTATRTRHPILGLIIITVFISYCGYAERFIWNFLGHLQPSNPSFNVVVMMLSSLPFHDRP